jgi:sulfonate transport system ATP-binding protein
MNKSDSAMPLLTASINSKSFGNKRVLGAMEISVAKGELITLLGASGCGKSTLLRMIAGLDTDYDGEVYLQGQLHREISNEIGFIFQEPRLMPWLNVAKNVAFKSNKPEEELARVSTLLDEVGLAGTEELLPKELSGGMAQRVSIARGMFLKPKLLLLDEPFSAVDAFTRMKLQDLLLSVAKQHGTTVIMVTHDIDEAIYLSDRIIIVGGQPGVIKEVVTVHQQRPRDRLDLTLASLRTTVLSALHEIQVI